MCLSIFIIKYFPFLETFFWSTILQICGGMVWSPLSVDSAIQEAVLPFLRIAAVFKFRLFEEQIPSIANKDNEITILAEYLGLVSMDLLSFFVQRGSMRDCPTGENSCKSVV